MGCKSVLMTCSNTTVLASYSQMPLFQLAKTSLLRVSSGLLSAVRLLYKFSSATLVCLFLDTAVLALVLIVRCCDCRVCFFYVSRPFMIDQIPFKVLSPCHWFPVLCWMAVCSSRMVEKGTKL